MPLNEITEPFDEADQMVHAGAVVTVNVDSPTDDTGP